MPPGRLVRLRDRVRARLLAHSIDDRLLRGQASDRNPVVLTRLARLLSRRYRSRVAASLRRLLGEARRSGRPPLTARLEIKQREVLGSEPLILTLADELEEEENVNPRGVILADRLITDGSSPVYRPDPIYHPPQESVEAAVRHARAALHLG
jgi:hypothetical protein